jgi:hypothetical protein
VQALAQTTTNRRLDIQPYTAQLQPDWDRVVRTSRNGNFLHLRDYMDYHADRFQDCSVLVMRRGTPVAVFPANRQGDLVASHAGLTYAGLIYLPELYATEVLEIFDCLGEHYRAAGARRILYKAIPHPMHHLPAEEDLYALFRMGATLVRRDLSSVIRMDQRPGMTVLRRKGVARARAARLTLREGNFLPEFHALLTQVLARHDAAPVHTLAEMELLKRRFPDQIRLFGAFAAQGELLAAILVYDYGKVVHTQYCAASAAGREVGALDLLMFEAINSEFSGRSYFSFGISTEEQGRVLNEGLVHQKEGFGGRGVAHDFYQWEI